MRGKGDVDGVYRLLEEATEKRDEVCVDGCVYSKVSLNDFSAVQNEIMMIVIGRTESLGVNIALREWPRWRRGQRWPALLMGSVVDNQ